MGYNTPNLQKRWESNLGQLGEKREPYSALNNFIKIFSQAIQLIFLLLRRSNDSNWRKIKLHSTWAAASNAYRFVLLFLIK